ncbi:LLM class flavin-dependent oxidoreductase [Bacillus daqingensis]|uniref:LLM class flavin-dependent oxidoreductase n=1 Tax=Bacillus daqingensis TaxID=872396 RepID=A0ABV9NP10_9BACI
MRLSVLDQSPVVYGGSARISLHQSIELAAMAEKLDYYRYWAAEHHDSPGLACTAPEILLSRIGSQTSVIRLGTGGLLLPHYSAYRAAELFHMLEALYPGRIDAGIGRAPGGMPRASLALSEGRPRNAARYPEQLEDLLNWLHDRPVEKYVYGEAKAGPSVRTAPPVWILGSSEKGAALAAAHGLPFTFAHFINEEETDRAAAVYVDQFQSSEWLDEPYFMAAASVVCAPTDKEAERLAKSVDLAVLSAEKGAPLPEIPHPEEAEAHDWSGYDGERQKENRRRLIVGSAKSAASQLQELAARTKAQELMIISNLHSHENRMQSYRLIAEELLHQ